MSDLQTWKRINVHVSTTKFGLICLSHQRKIRVVGLGTLRETPQLSHLLAVDLR